MSVSRLFDRVSVCVDLVSVCDRVEIYQVPKEQYPDRYEYVMWGARAFVGEVKRTTTTGTGPGTGTYCTV